MKKNKIVVTGGAGFIGSHLIENLLNLSEKYKVISIDNYSTGSKKNHIINSRVKYLKSDTKNINKILNAEKNKICAIFHFGEFSRIFQSFLRVEECMNSNSTGSNAVFNFCLQNKIKLIYSATSASIGNNGNDKNLSPYAFTKSKNLELLENLKHWYKFKCEIIYFYNVYGPRQIRTGPMATVIGIFEEQYKENKTLTIVKPGNQSRRFTHINDTIDICIKAWQKNKNRHYLITSKKSYTIMEVAKMFKTKIRFLKPRRGERFVSAISDHNLIYRVYKSFGKINLSDYIKNIIN